jgi:hypothetical protein
MAAEQGSWVVQLQNPPSSTTPMGDIYPTKYVIIPRKMLPKVAAINDHFRWVKWILQLNRILAQLVSNHQPGPCGMVHG